MSTPTTRTTNESISVFQHWMLVNKKADKEEIHYGGGVQIKIQGIYDMDHEFRFYRVYGLPTSVTGQMGGDRYSLVCVGTEHIWICPAVVRGWATKDYLITSADTSDKKHLVVSTLSEPLGYLEFPVVS